MRDDPVRRKLAAIVAADMVGYSRLMEADEADTISRQKSLLADLFDPKIGAHGGRIVKTTGDGLLVEFPGAVAAVQCAIDLQSAMIEHEIDQPAHRRILYRMGINLGEIVVDGDDILGEDVNLAARLEGLSDAGGICISAKVKAEIDGKLDEHFEDCGEQPVKNISRPVHVFRFRPDGDEPTERRMAATAEPRLKIPDKPSIAVLAFNNLSGDPEQGYFVDGITEDIITELSRYREFFVVARHSSFAYKGKAIDTKTIGRELGVRYLLEGSLRRAGNRLRITAQLIDALTDIHVWAEKYDRPMGDLFELQDEITRNIAGALGATVMQSEQSAALRKLPNSLDAYEYALRAGALNQQITRESNRLARQEAEAAIECDPTYPTSYITRAISSIVMTFSGWTTDPAAALRSAKRDVQQAIVLDKASDYAHAILGWAELYLGNHDRAVSAGRRAVELNPNQADGYAWLACSLSYSGEPAEALTMLKMANRLNPLRPSWYATYESRCYFMLGRYEEAIDAAKSAAGDGPAYTTILALRAASHSKLGQSAEAEAAVAELRAVSPGYTLAFVPTAAPFKHEKDIREYVNALRHAGLSE